MNQQQIKEWTESEVTIALRDRVQESLGAVQELKSRAYSRGNPQETQETLAYLIGQEVTLDDMLMALDGTWTWLEDSDEQ